MSPCDVVIIMITSDGSKGTTHCLFLMILSLSGEELLPHWYRSLAIVSGVKNFHHWQPTYLFSWNFTITSAHKAFKHLLGVRKLAFQQAIMYILRIDTCIAVLCSSSSSSIIFMNSLCDKATFLPNSSCVILVNTL